jgi:menaquinone-dependent protoporphyrinogen oxidase
MRPVQVVYASRHGGTAGIAERIGDGLGSGGAAVVVADASNRPDPTGFDGYVIGSGVYVGSWLKDGLEFLEQHASLLAERPVWLFSSGPLPHPSKTTEAKDPLTRALGPEDGPGSGGRRKIAALSAAIHPLEHRVFLGAFDPNDPPTSIQERLVRTIPAAKRVLPAGDFREWDVIEARALEFATNLVARRP